MTCLGLRDLGLGVWAVIEILGLSFNPKPLTCKPLKAAGLHPRARLAGYGLTLLPSPTFQLYGMLCKSNEGHDALASFAFLSFHLQDVLTQTCLSVASLVSSALSMLVSTSS